MEPVIIEKKNYSQAIITVLLLFVLAGIIGGYIYFGMWQARQLQPVVDTEVAPPAVDVGPELSSEDKLKILEELAKQSGTGTPATIEEKEAILNKLSAEASTDTSISDEEKMRVLNELSKPSAGTEAPLTTEGTNTVSNDTATE